MPSKRNPDKLREWLLNLVEVERITARERSQPGYAVRKYFISHPALNDCAGSILTVGWINSFLKGKTPQHDKLVQFDDLMMRIEEYRKNSSNTNKLAQWRTDANAVNTYRELANRALHAYFSKVIRGSSPKNKSKNAARKPPPWEDFGFFFNSEYNGEQFQSSLIGSRHWVPTALQPLDKVRLNWDASLSCSDEPIDPRRHSDYCRFTKGTEADLSHRIVALAKEDNWPRKPWDGLLYRVSSIKETGPFEATFGHGWYFDFLNSAEDMTYRAALLAKAWDEARMPKASNNGKPSDDDLFELGRQIVETDRIHRPSSKEQFLEFSERGCMTGLNTLLVVVPRHPYASPFIYMHERNSKNAVTRGQRNVVPAGVFQNWIRHDIDHDHEFRLEETLLRELCEELLEKEDEMNILRDSEEYLHIRTIEALYETKKIPKLQHARRLILDNKVVRKYFLGCGIDLLTCDPEFLALAVMSEEKTWHDLWSDHNFKSKLEAERDGEGRVYTILFTEKEVCDELRHPKLHPVAYSCLSQALKLFRPISNAIETMRREGQRSSRR